MGWSSDLNRTSLCIHFYLAIHRPILNSDLRNTLIASDLQGRKFWVRHGVSDIHVLFFEPANCKDFRKFRLLRTVPV